MPELEPDWASPAPANFRLRNYQAEWRDAVWAQRNTRCRVIIDAAGGTGKSSVFAALALKEWNELGGRTLVLENRDGLVRQTAQRIRDETGLECDIEMASEHASPFTPVVVASVQTLGRIARLTGFSDTHFSLVVCDEAHLGMAALHIRVLSFFHWGAESLQEGWKRPADGTYKPKCLIVGTTATPEEKMGRFYQGFIEPRYSYLKAVDDGWLVPPIAKSVPVKIGLRKFRMGRTANGSDYRPEDLSAAIIPIVEELAQQVNLLASDRKTIAFVPSVECARLLAEAIVRQGMKAIFVSGACLDVNEKTEAFISAGPGTVLCNCALYVAGRDFPDVDCVAWFRASISRSFVVQGMMRGTRVLPGLVDDDMTADERRAAIAASAKPNLLILDPLFITDRIDLCSYVDLLTDDPGIKKRLQAMPGDDLLEEATKAERDLIAGLEKEAKKHKDRVARAINPLTFGVSLNDDALKNYVPTQAWEARTKLRDEQIEFLEAHGFNPAKSPNQGHADKFIKRIIDRAAMKLATPERIEKLRKMLRIEDGRPVPMWTDEQLYSMPDAQARAIIWKMGAKGRTKQALRQLAQNAGKVVDYQNWSGTEVG